MKVGIIGTGYVGLPTGIGFAELGHEIICVDQNISKIKTLKSGNLTIYENGLSDLLKKNVEKKRLRFTSSMSEGVKNADIILIAVGTPPHPVTHETDMKYIYEAATELAHHLNGYTVIAIKSTVPVGTGDNVQKLISKINPRADFEVISLPEFLREGFAIHDFFNPDRIIIGSDSDRANNVIRELYKPFPSSPKMLFVKRRSAETIKYASNAFLAVKIHYINEMANFCEKVGADISEVAQGMGSDSRIGPKFLNAGPGYGGSCFPKDTMAMAYMARMNNVEMTLIEDVIQKNAERKKQMAYRVLDTIQDIPNAKITILGLAFKNGTDDCRESPAIEITSELLQHCKNITVYDPKAMDTAKNILGNAVQYAPDMYTAMLSADVLVILTEWDEFKTLNLKHVAELMSNKRIVDCRNLLDPKQTENLGFTYKSIGR